MFNSYEEYMQSVLGMNTPNTYANTQNTYGINRSGEYFEPRMQEANLQEVNKLYPEIYGIVYPMVQKACSMRSIGIINEVQINEMVEEVYNALEPREEMERGTENSNTLKNGDVKNPRAKETREVRRPNNNYLLRDLIRILIIRELLQGGWQGNMMPRPPMGGPGGPGGPGGMPGGRPPAIRPRIYGNVLINIKLENCNKICYNNYVNVPKWHF